MIDVHQGASNEQDLVGPDITLLHHHTLWNERKSKNLMPEGENRFMGRANTSPAIENHIVM